MCILGLVLAVQASAAQIDEVRDIVFPVDGEVFFKDDFDQPRSGGRTHEATDLIGEKFTPLLSAVDGVVTFLPETEPSWGWGVWITDDEGYEYVYLHVNNDNPGTDDGNGGIEHAFAPDVREGARVTRGQFIGYMGDSGNAENVTDHLHFEIHAPDGTRLNPYQSLLAAQSGGEVFQGADYERDEVLTRATSISVDKRLSVSYDAYCTGNTLIKGTSTTTVYYCGHDGKRYFFPSDRVFFSWYDSFNNVEVITDTELASIPLGGNVTFRPGTRLIKIQSDPKVYAIDSYGVLRWVPTASKAVEHFGENWESLLEDVDVAFFTNYELGETVQ
jgi:hypothetical protein